MPSNLGRFLNQANVTSMRAIVRFRWAREKGDVVFAEYKWASQEDLMEACCRENSYAGGRDYTT